MLDVQWWQHSRLWEFIYIYIIFVVAVVIFKQHLHCIYICALADAFIQSKPFTNGKNTIACHVWWENNGTEWCIVVKKKGVREMKSTGVLIYLPSVFYIPKKKARKTTHAKTVYFPPNVNECIYTLTIPLYIHTPIYQSPCFLMLTLNSADCLDRIYTACLNAFNCHVNGTFALTCIWAATVCLL